MRAVTTILDTVEGERNLTNLTPSNPCWEEEPTGGDRWTNEG
jgi:hypothetical protein